jgi:hypothetical protein
LSSRGQLVQKTELGALFFFQTAKARRYSARGLLIRSLRDAVVRVERDARFDRVEQVLTQQSGPLYRSSASETKHVWLVGRRWFSAAAAKDAKKLAHAPLAALVSRSHQLSNASRLARAKRRPREPRRLPLEQARHHLVRAAEEARAVQAAVGALCAAAPHRAAQREAVREVERVADGARKR